MKNHIIFVIMPFLLISSFIYAGGSKPTDKFTNKDDWRFIENKGQLNSGLKQKGIKEDEVKYYIHSAGLNIYCKPGMISFVFSKSENETDQISEATNFPLSFTDIQKFDSIQKQQIIKCDRMDFTLINANPSPIMIASDPLNYYENYYTDNEASNDFLLSHDGINKVHAFKTITYKNIYTNIDMLLKIGQGYSLEYAFLVHPGGRVGQIKIRWNGANEMAAYPDECLPDGELGAYCYGNSLGNIEESLPKSFVEEKEIKTSIKRIGDCHGFNVADYDKKKDLLIDPTMFATYFGGGGTDQALGVSTDGSGNVFITGQTTSGTNIASSGAYQTSLTGTTNVFLAKFDNTGAEAWATYYGGTGADMALAVSTDGSGNAYITGQTTSATGIATSGVYQSTFAGTGVGVTDAFVAKFSGSGTLSWGTYYGGTSMDEGLGIAVDGSGNVDVTGLTKSNTKIATAGSHQSTRSGSQDAFIAQFSSTGTLNWGTYFGGTGTSGFGLSIDGSNNIIITGSTGGTTLIATAGAFQTSYQGGTDAFLAQFTSTGAISWGTYFGGTGSDQGKGVSLDGSGNIYIVGVTASTSGIATSGTYQSTMGGSGDAFLAKFNSSGNEIWGTYYGGNQNTVGNAVSVDGSGNINVTGRTNSSAAIATAGSYQTAYVVSASAITFLAQFSNAGSLTWGTYYGGAGSVGVDEGDAISTDGSGNIYITGKTASNSGIATSGAYQTGYGGSNDGYLAEFNSLGALPVTFMSFNALYDANHVNLTWNTASEINNNYFDIERSIDGATWQNIGKVSGHGNSSVIENYGFVDNLQGNVPRGTIYYRLRQVDYNLASNYSEIRGVTINGVSDLISIYPNPATNILNVNWMSTANKNTIVKLIDPMGKTIYLANITGSGVLTKQIDLSGYGVGMYYLQIITDQKTSTQAVYKN